MTDASAAIKDAAEEAANSVISAHGITVDDDESCFEALCWALGADVPYQKGLLQFAQAIVDGFDLNGLVEAKIELLGEYKLDYPQDYARRRHPHAGRAAAAAVAAADACRTRRLTVSGHSKRPEQR